MKHPKIVFANGLRIPLEYVRTLPADALLSKVTGMQLILRKMLPLIDVKPELS